MSKGAIQRIQDPVHGLMEFRGMETLVIDILRTPEIQRLRRIRQLGLAHLVFPGAEHSRLVHSLGAAWLAVRFGRQLADSAKTAVIDVLLPTPSSIRDLAVAALCHDLGHGPLSHAWEREVIGKNWSYDSWARKLGFSDAQRLNMQGRKWHEVVTSALLLWPDGQLHKLLEQNESKFSERIRYLLQGKYYLQYLPRLLSSDVDVDRADFLRRDTHCTGVAYGRYDLDWIISTSTIGTAEDGALVCGFDRRKAIRSIEQFLIARQALYETVYYHKTVHAAEGLIALFLRRAKHIVTEGDAKIEGHDLVMPYVRLMKGEPLDQAELLSLDDFSLSVVIDIMTNMPNGDATLRDLGRRILARDLFKLVPCRREAVAEFVRRPGAYELIYDAIKPFCPGDPHYYLIVDELDFSMFCKKKDEFAYLIDTERGRLATPLCQDSAVKHHANQSSEIRLFTIREAMDSVVKLIR
jgi:uncharacterized protein